MIHIKIPPQFDSDVIIVGAGPAGAAAATHMAKSGLRVLLVDRQIFPRDKVCGDFVGPVALLELQRLGITSLAEYKQSNVIHDAAVYLDGKHLITSSIPDIPGLPAHGRVAPRKILDEWVVNAARSAGTQVLEGYAARSFTTDANGVTLTIERDGQTRQLRAKVLIGADGSSSQIARLMRGHPPLEADRIIALRAYFEGIAGPADQADLYFTGESFPGYYWLFPTSATAANVGIGMVLETVPRTDDHLRALLLRLIEQDTALHARLRGAHLIGKIVGWPLTTYNPHLPIVSDRVVLIGDAAGLINSLNGEGIQYALLSGRWAAETVAVCVAKDDFSQGALQHYATRVQQELRYDMALAGLIVQLIRNRSLNPFWLQALRIIIARARIDPGYADITGGVLAGLVPASSVISTKVVRSTLAQAAFSLGIGAIKHTWGGPAHLAQLGLDTARTGFDISSTIVQHPTEFIKWSLGVVTSAVELGGQITQHINSPVKNSGQMDERSPVFRLSVH